MTNALGTAASPPTESISQAVRFVLAGYRRALAGVAGTAFLGGVAEALFLVVVTRCRLCDHRRRRPRRDRRRTVLVGRARSAPRARARDAAARSERLGELAVGPALVDRGGASASSSGGRLPRCFLGGTAGSESGESSGAADWLQRSSERTHESVDAGCRVRCESRGADRHGHRSGPLGRSRLGDLGRTPRACPPSAPRCCQAARTRGDLGRHGLRYVSQRGRRSRPRAPCLPRARCRPRTRGRTDRTRTRDASAVPVRFRTYRPHLHRSGLPGAAGCARRRGPLRRHQPDFARRRHARHAAIARVRPGRPECLHQPVGERSCDRGAQATSCVLRDGSSPRRNEYLSTRWARSP